MSGKALRNKQIAETILHQLGGSVFTLMTGSKSFVAVDNGLQFTVRSDAEYDVNKMRIVLTPEDTYDVSAMTIHGITGEVEEKCAISGIHADQLQDAFYSCTGFLCTMRHNPTNFFYDGNQLEDSPNLASPIPEPEDMLTQSGLPKDAGMDPHC